MRLTDPVAACITFKRSIGTRFRTQPRLLRGFCRAVGDGDTSDVRPEAVLAFLSGTGPITRAWELCSRTPVRPSIYRRTDPLRSLPATGCLTVLSWRCSVRASLAKRWS